MERLTMHTLTTRIVAILALGAMVATGSMLGWPARVGAAPTQAPEFAGIAHWINSPPLTMRGLRGKVVLIDFWTYSCINCLRTLPHVTRWYDKYKDQGLVVIGVHSPEFDFEKRTANVERAVKHFGIHYPVAQDNDMATWNAWNNSFWPAEYLVDKQGKVVLHHYGEGHYAEMENAIRKQLGMAPMTDTGPEAGLGDIESPEMYFGIARMQYMANAKGPSRNGDTYRAPSRLALNRYALDGRWRMTDEYAQLLGDRGEIRLHFKAGKLHMVASAERPVTLKITVDGKPQPPVTVQASMLYTLFDSTDYRDHVVSIDIPHAGLRAFTFTFG
jgi:thiol-disulfide isomerase/thioredoxin